MNSVILKHNIADFDFFFVKVGPKKSLTSIFLQKTDNQILAVVLISCNAFYATIQWQFFFNANYDTIIDLTPQIFL